MSFGPHTLGLALAHLQAAAAHLTALGDYPRELGFRYELESAKRRLPADLEEHHEEV